MDPDETGGGRRLTVSERAAAVPPALGPEAAFKILGNETRLTILDTLWAPWEPEPMAFEKLRKAVGISDGSQFNYHLKKLLDGEFVQKIDGKYAIRHAGAEVVWAVRRGYLTDHPELEPWETSGRCGTCGEPLYARYADELFFVECHACDRLHHIGPFPPTALADRTPVKALLVHDLVARTNVTLARRGICPMCNARMDRTLARDYSESPVRSFYLDEDDDRGLTAWHVCSQCGVWVSITPMEAVVDHPAVVELYREHGFDLDSVPRWELPWLVDPSNATVVTDDPLRVTVTVAVEDNELVLTLDEGFEVVDVGRTVANTGC
ncbi:winged helix-turn-helix domain-containing protein [Halorarius litoreus]|uniref:winged helix-turn-helix domain-containing protein n=1 Tax=Halorarius litoreus TaxID=2962676 RepID=UPI0020CC209A|nr:helix-turn-helix domain-containing protein [Halorarius litoreus]